MPVERERDNRRTEAHREVSRRRRRQREEKG